MELKDSLKGMKKKQLKNMILAMDTLIQLREKETEERVGVYQDVIVDIHQVMSRIVTVEECYVDWVDCPPSELCCQEVGECPDNKQCSN